MSEGVALLLTLSVSHFGVRPPPNARNFAGFRAECSWPQPCSHLFLSRTLHCLTIFLISQNSSDICTILWWQSLHLFHLMQPSRTCWLSLCSTKISNRGTVIKNCPVPLITYTFTNFFLLAAESVSATWSLLPVIDLKGLSHEIDLVFDDMHGRF